MRYVLCRPTDAQLATLRGEPDPQHPLGHLAPPAFMLAPDVETADRVSRARGTEAGGLGEELLD